MEKRQGYNAGPATHAVSSPGPRVPECRLLPDYALSGSNPGAIPVSGR